MLGLGLCCTWQSIDFDTIPRVRTFHVLCLVDSDYCEGFTRAVLC